LRVGQTIALAVVTGVGGLLLLLSKSKSHYVTIEYIDVTGNAQSVVFEIGKDAIRPLLSSLETRTGKIVVDQPDPTKTKQIKK
jgi:cell division septal protein FtsQ